MATFVKVCRGKDATYGPRDDYVNVDTILTFYPNFINSKETKVVFKNDFQTVLPIHIDDFVELINKAQRN